MDDKLKSATLPDDLRARAEEILTRGTNPEQTTHYIDWITSSLGQNH